MSSEEPQDTTISFNPLDFPSIFTKPRRLVHPLGWVEHIPFAMFLIEVLKPRVLVELGTHSGNSYTAFCQAVQQNHLDTRCYAVDTWEGDEHSGFYGPEVLQDLRDHHDLLYGGFSCLIQSTFDEAVHGFPSEGIDLLHIDGLHTYDNVRHDFETWHSKVSPNGVILFHDINVREADFGVWKFWVEIAAQYPHFEFVHGHGLGVLALTEAQPEPLLKLLNVPPPQAARIRRFFSAYGGSLRLQSHIQHSGSIPPSIRGQVDTNSAHPGHITGSRDGIPCGYAQFYTPTRGVHVEERSQRVALLTNEWTNITFSFHGGDKDETIPLRFDPVDRTGIVEIASIKIISQVHNSPIWQAVAREEFQGIRMSGTAVTLPDRGTFTVFCYGGDSQIYLPNMPGLSDYGPLNFEAWVRFLPDLTLVSDLVSDLRDQFIDTNNRFTLAQEANFKLEEELTALIAQKTALLAQKTALLAQKTDEIALYRDLADQRETTNRALRRLLMERDRQIREIYESVSWRITAPLRRFAWIKSAPFWRIFTALSDWRFPFARRTRTDRANDRRTIRQSGLFDARYYLRRYKDVASAGIDPLRHFVHHGAIEGRNPNRFFHTTYYLKQHPDIAASGINPLVHFIQFGAAQKLNPSPLFDTRRYLDEHPELANSQVNPLLDFIKHNHLDSDYLLSDYEIWIKQNAIDTVRIEQILEIISTLFYNPVISIIMPVYNIDAIWLDRAIQSVLNQLYPHWELCIIDDASTQGHIQKLLKHYSSIDTRIKVKYFDTNQGMAIAYNEALSMATGDFVATLDHDDELTPDALYENVRLLNNNPSLDIIYSDEDKIDLENRRDEPFFKPDFSLDLLLSMNYICHFTLIRRSLLNEIDGFRSGFDGSQDYDLILRAVEKTKSIAHISKILYHWRKMPGSAASTPDIKPYALASAKIALTDYLARNDIQGHVEDGLFTGTYRVRRNLTAAGMVSIIIPFRDKVSLLQTCLTSLLKKTAYQDYEILLLNNQSQETSTYDYLETFTHNSKVRILNYDNPFNYSAMNNYAVDQAQGPYILFLNNDIEVISTEWLSAMLEHGQRDEVGAVGAKLLYPNNTIQHAGVVIGLGTADHAFKHFPADDHGYCGYASVIRNYSAVTAACMLMRKDVFLQMGGLDDTNLPIAFNDVDLCLRLAEAGYKIVYTPYALLYHHESISRGKDNDPALLATNPDRYHQARSETIYIETKWAKYIDHDPMYNIHLTKDNMDFSVRLWA